MKVASKHKIVFMFWFFVLIFAFASPLLAQLDINTTPIPNDLSTDTTKSSSYQSSDLAAESSVPTIVATPSANPASNTNQIDITVPDSSPLPLSTNETGLITSTPSSDAGQKKLSMMDYYRAGVQSYDHKNFHLAIADLKTAIEIKNLSVKSFYYAEANAMIGVIYKFDISNPRLARQYCMAALRIDPATETAQKLIHEIDFSNTQTEKDYWTGIKLFEKGHYTQAIKVLEKMVHQKDRATPSFYYTEANTTLGVIYQFHRINQKLAYRYYKAALKIDPANHLAKRNISKLSYFKN